MRVLCDVVQVDDAPAAAAQCEYILAFAIRGFVQLDRSPENCHMLITLIGLCATFLNSIYQTGIAKNS